MMIYAYLFILQATDQEEESQIDEIKQLPHIKEVYELYGIYDVVVFIEAESMDQLREVILQSIRQLKSVKSTITFISLDEYNKLQE